MKIGLISDTHGYLDERVFSYFENCDEIWHSGDVGSLEVIEKLENFKPIRGVYGNIDGQEIRLRWPKEQYFECEGKKIWITHIGGKPPRYNPEVRNELKINTPDIFICGHSHILRVMTDPALNKMLYLNPGAAGVQGFHKIRTLLRFEINQGKVENMQAIELGPRSLRQ
jgi:uncharacterized protein